MGSPYDRLAPLEIGEPIGLAGGVAIAAVFAAIVMGLFLIPTREPQMELVFVVLTVAVCVAMPLGRWASYAACHRRPFGFRKTPAIRGRPFIPEYDQIFVPTLGALVASVAAIFVLRAIGAPWFIAAPAGIVVNFAMLLGCGPSGAAWSLTGGHNISLRGRPPETTPQPRVRVKHQARR